MSLNVINWGILGTSYISEVMAKAIQESTISQLKAVGSRSLSKAKMFADQFSIPKYFSNYQDLLNDPEIDAIYIGLPNHLHKQWIIHCAEAGKHILCEKPFVTTAKEAREVISFLEKTNVFCMEALMYRCHPLTKKIQELIQSKIIGEIKLYHAVYSANIASVANPTAGGSIRNLGCYPISLIRLLSNAEPTEIIALGRMDQMNQNDNQASITLKFPDQSIAVVSTADDIDMFWQFDVYGSEGHLKIETNPWLPEKNNNKILIFRNNQKDPIEINVSADKSLYTYQIDTLSSHVIKGIVTNHDGISLDDSLGNITLLDIWFQQLKNSKLCNKDKKNEGSKVELY